MKEGGVGENIIGVCGSKDYVDPWRGEGMWSRNAERAPRNPRGHMGTRLSSKYSYLTSTTSLDAQYTPSAPKNLTSKGIL